MTPLSENYDRTMSEMLDTSVGVFEVDWYVGATGTSIALDPDAGRADLAEIIDVASPADVAAALQQVGVPTDEAQRLALGLWDRRWRGPDGAA
jgi:hypothetical protein